MAEITLPKYLQYVNSLIDDSRLAEAVAHSRHILEQHPRYLDAYRALGKALLEQGDYPGAVDVLQRVLSAAPADFIAHVGLAIVHKAGDRWKEALWHLERAFEVEPYNPAIRSELQDLYGRRDGLAPEQPELTQGALARFYVKGGLYQQAILELRELLEADPERVDLRLLLAEALWRADERVEAAEVCHQLLELLPDCLEANAILANILLQTGDAETAEPYLRRVQELTQVAAATLDPAAPFAEPFTLPGALPLPREVWVDRLSDQVALGMSVQAEAAAWMGELDLEAAGVEDDFDWLRDLQDEGGEILPPGEEEEREFEWLDEAAAAAGEAVAAAPAKEEPSPEIEAAPDWVQSLGDEEIDWTESSGDSGELPGWMQSEARDLDWLDEPVAASTPEWLEEAPAPGEEESDWLEGTGATPEADPSLIDEAAESAEPGALPPSLDEGLAAMSETAAAGAGEEEELPQWELESEVGDEQRDEAVPEEFGMVDQGNERDERPDAGDAEEPAEELDWLEELGEADETPPASPPEVPAASELPDWLQEEAAEAAGLDWVPDDEEEGERRPSRMATESPPDDEMAAWLRSEVGDVDTAGDDLSWLDQIAGGQAEPPEEMPTLEWPEDAEITPEAAADTPAVEAPEEPLPESADEELDWLDALASEDATGDDAWLDELAGGAEELESDDSGSEPRLFTEDITGLDWLEDPAQEEDEPEPAAGHAEASLDWLGEIAAAPDTEEEAADWLAESAEEDAVGDAVSSETVIMGDEEAEVEMPAGEDFIAAEDEHFTGEADEMAELTWLDEFDAEDETVAPEPSEADEAEDATDLVGAEQFVAADEEEPVLDWLEAEPESGETAMEEEPEEAPEPPALTEEAALEAAPEPAEEGEELEEALTWLDEVPEGAAVEPETAPPQDLDEAMAQLDAGEAEPLDADAVPEDLDEAMTWLEQLAAQQGAPLDELPSLAAGEAPEAAEGEAGPEEEAAELELSAEETPELNLEWMETLAEARKATEAEVEPEAAAAGEEDYDVPEDLDEAMAWLEGLAARQGAPTDELPSVSADDELLAEALDDEFAEEIGEPSAELLLEADEGDFVDEGDVPDDLEEAMVWLEELAAQQAAAAEAPPAAPAAEEEVPVEEPVDEEVAEPEPEEVPEPEMVAEEETPEAMVLPDVAMMYLDSLVEREGRIEDEEEPAEEVEPIAGLAAEIPDDLEGMLAWFEQLASGAEAESPTVAAEEPDLAVEEEDGEALPETALFVEEEPEFAAPEPDWTEEEAASYAAEPGAEMAVDVDEVPEDPDEVMAWLERLAARQGASLDELPTVDEISDDIETPAWLAADVAEAEAEADEAPAGEVAPAAEEEAAAGWIDEAPDVPPGAEDEVAEWLDDETGLEWLDAVTRDEPSEGLEWLEDTPAAVEPEQETTDEEPDLAVLEEDSEPVMPDWLALDEERWGEEEPDIASWLAAEEELSQVSLETPPPSAVPQATPEPEAAPEPAAAAPVQRLPAAENMDADQLESARAALDAGDMEGALNVYQKLLEAGEGLNVVIGDLELATEGGYEPALCRVLGDAYMENGQLNRALEVYRKALDLL
jgi:tetratricopeptide (TPR) repeat protein